jgi:hypothetical protein
MSQNFIVQSTGDRAERTSHVTPVGCIPGGFGRRSGRAPSVVPFNLYGRPLAARFNDVSK